ncbi:MAG: CHC2 zinc finger domain-containing protein, partial [Peptoniphilus harei]
MYVINDNVLDEIRDRADIVDLIGEYVDLKRSGSNYMGLCPFHSEKTPSFS